MKYQINIIFPDVQVWLFQIMYRVGLTQVSINTKFLFLDYSQNQLASFQKNSHHSSYFISQYAVKKHTHSNWQKWCIFLYSPKLPGSVTWCDDVIHCNEMQSAVWGITNETCHACTLAKWRNEVFESQINTFLYKHPISHTLLTWFISYRKNLVDGSYQDFNTHTFYHSNVIGNW